VGDVSRYGLTLLVAALAFLVAVLSSRMSAWLRVPAPAIFLVGAAVAANLVKSLAHIPTHTTERLVTVALIVVLFDGGMHIGWRRFRSAAGPIVLLGVVGTLVTAAGVAFALFASFCASACVSTIVLLFLATTLSRSACASAIFFWPSACALVTSAWTFAGSGP